MQHVVLVCKALYPETRGRERGGGGGGREWGALAFLFTLPSHPGARTAAWRLGRLPQVPPVGQEACCHWRAPPPRPVLPGLQPVAVALLLPPPPAPPHFRRLRRCLPSTPAATSAAPNCQSAPAAAAAEVALQNSLVTGGGGGAAAVKALQNGQMTAAAAVKHPPSGHPPSGHPPCERGEEAAAAAGGC